MKLVYFFKKNLQFVFLFLISASILFFSNHIYAGMQGSAYKIQSDTINFGGADSSSTNYKLNDTLGEVGTGDSNSTNYYAHAGFWQMQESFISISSPNDLIMTSMGGLSGGSSEGSISWQVLTDNIAGYAMTIAASTSPALKSPTDSLADYAPSTSDPDYTFTNPSTDSSFGFSPEGTDISSRFKDNGSSCNTGSLDTLAKCWDGLSLTPKIVAESTTSNMPLGSTVSVRFRAESGADHIQTSGQYDVTIIATATTL